MGRRHLKKVFSSQQLLKPTGMGPPEAVREMCHPHFPSRKDLLSSCRQWGLQTPLPPPPTTAPLFRICLRSKELPHSKSCSSQRSLYCWPSKAKLERLPISSSCGTLWRAVLTPEFPLYWPSVGPAGVATRVFLSFQRGWSLISILYPKPHTSICFQRS